MTIYSFMGGFLSGLAFAFFSQEVGSLRKIKVGFLLYRNMAMMATKKNI